MQSKKDKLWLKLTHTVSCSRMHTRPSYFQTAESGAKPFFKHSLQAATQTYKSSFLQKKAPTILTQASLHASSLSHQSNGDKQCIHIFYWMVASCFRVIKGLVLALQTESYCWIETSTIVQHSTDTTLSRTATGVFHCEAVKHAGLSSYSP